MQNPAESMKRPDQEPTGPSSFVRSQDFARSQERGAELEQDGLPEARDPRLARVRALMQELAAGERFERLGAIVQEHLLTGGKQVRARLALDAVSALGGEDDVAVAWAAACELLHNATLIHDDLQDRDEIRRGRYSVWVRHGFEQAINAGDLLLMLPFVAIEHMPVDAATRWELARAIARRSEDTVRGQSLEMSLLSSCRWDWESYREAATKKTAALIALPVQGAAVLAGREAGRAQSTGDAFLELGLLFQMQDDLIDLFGKRHGRPPGGDIREGKVTALVVEHLARHPHDLEWLGPLLGKPRSETTEEDIRFVSRQFEQRGALEGVLGRIAEARKRIERCAVLASEPELQIVTRGLVKTCMAPIAHLVRQVV